MEASMAFRVAVVGLGGIAQKGHLPVLVGWEGIELLFYTRTPEKLERLADQYRVQRRTSNLDELMSWQPQVAVILTPTPSHFELASHFLQAGADVFMEKPATGSSAETRRLAELADQQQRILMLAFNRRYAPLSIKGRELWGDRKVTLANFQKSRSKPHFKSLFMHMNEELVHIVDMLRFFCGEGHAIKTAANLGPDELVYEVASLIQLENGGFATVTATLRGGLWYEHYELNGDETTLNLDAFSELKLSSKGQTQVWREPYDSSWQSNLVGRGFVGQMEHFMQCVETRQQPQTNAWDSVKTQELVESILAAR